MSQVAPPLRGQVLQVEVGLGEPKLFVVVSNNGRNAKFNNVLGARLTTRNKPSIRSVVELTVADDPLHGRVVCDDVYMLYTEDVLKVRGVLSRPTMRNVDNGLRFALALL